VTAPEASGPRRLNRQESITASALNARRSHAWYPIEASRTQRNHRLGEITIALQVRPDADYEIA
jgi:hypothetical protein